MKIKSSDKYDRILKLFKRKGGLFHTDLIFYMEKTKMYLIRIKKLLDALDNYFETRVFYDCKGSHIKVLRENIYSSALETINYTIEHILREVFGGE